ncbi:MAG: hypothetical protein KF865_11300 [Bdellovibrionaceae bacterium]|nr:hypothetical protein [Pseudobdellovibrionaceae bacterium]
MKRVLVLEKNEDIRAILAIRISKTFQVQVVSQPLSQAIWELSQSDFSLVVSDVEDSENEGFWLHRCLAEHHPATNMILFISPERMLRNVPRIDSTVRAVVLKFEFERLIHEIKKLEVFDTYLSRQAMR